MKTKFLNSNLRCPICGDVSVHLFYEQKNIPICYNQLFSNKIDAKNCKKGDVILGYCLSCTYIFNTAFKNDCIYDEFYDNSLGLSECFQEYEKKLASELINDYNLYRKNILEIGIKKTNLGDLFRSLGQNVCKRTNPYLSKEKNNFGAFTSLSSTHLNLIDFIFCYNELEHIYSPVKLISQISSIAVRNLDLRLFFTVPNSLYSFKQGSFLDIYYEHVSYFTKPSLHFLFSKWGLDTRINTRNEVFNLLFVHAKKNESGIRKSSSNQREKIRLSIEEFSKNAWKKIENTKKTLDNILRSSQRVVIWGAGTKGVAFLNHFDVGIDYAVDINPTKQGKFAPGTGQKIVNPDFLRQYKPNIVLLCNSSYLREVNMALNRMDLDSKLIPIDILTR